MWLQYYLKTADPEESPCSQKWLLEFLDQIHAIENCLALQNIQVVYFTSLSRKIEFEASARTVVPFFYTAYLLIILSAIISCYRRQLLLEFVEFAQCQRMHQREINMAEEKCCKSSNKKKKVNREEKWQIPARTGKRKING
ncbi:patched domain-containing protein 3-like [Talpa occidentalis]|uniref:patched domain-containing protein 3-like n=1 Tax=Talpa occidentalis TaxID=50954 RepID=UPI0023F799EC|nr:patched domain-containing protein 3-like [Talpa occidentalis]